MDLPESGYLGTPFFKILLIAAAYHFPISEDESFGWLHSDFGMSVSKLGV